MNFKIHLAVIAIIIVAVYFAQTLLVAPPKPPEQPQVEKISAYFVSVVHASWGLNCLSQRFYGGDSDSDNSKNTKIKEDNVLSKVSSICNIKGKCEIPLTVEVLGEDPNPNCLKILQVDYRCFAIDRLRTAKTSDANLVIDCESQFPKKEP